MSNQDEARSVVEQVLAASRADEVHVNLDFELTQHLRFARNTPTTAGTYTNSRLVIESTFGKRSAAVSINQLDAPTLLGAVRQSEELARLAPEDPEHLPGLGPQTFAAVEAFDPELERQGAQCIADGSATCIERARQAGLSAFGFSSLQARSHCIANSRGLFAYHRQSEAHFSVTVRTPDGRGSGWASDVSNRASALDFAETGARAIQKAKASLAPKALGPGKYLTILEPTCVANLVQYLVQQMNARGADEGRSFFSKQAGGNRLGERLFPEFVNIYSDPRDSLAPGAPWGHEYLPQRRRDWLRAGTLETLVYERFWAEQRGCEPIPTPTNLIMTGSQSSLEELIASTARGVLITSLWYIRQVDPETLLLTGLTRDGVFWIEDGRIAHPVNNFRWNNSPLAVLKNIEAMSNTVRVAPRASEDASIAVPALRVRDFELSSVSDAV